MDKFKEFFSEDFLENKENNALHYLNKIFELENKTCAHFDLPEPQFIDVTKNEYDTKQNEINYSKQMFDSMCPKLNKDQKYIFDLLISENSKMFFIDGPGGSGKTFLYRTLIYYFVSIGKKIISMAWTGIASILLPKGMTSHRTFRLPLDLESIDVAFLEKKSEKQKLKNVDVIKRV